jgi:quinol monooxygenase YgiN
MPRVTMVRYTTKPGQDEENEKLSRAVFAELRANSPEHVSYAFFRNGSHFVHLFVNTRDDDAAMLTELASFKAYTDSINSRCEAPPEQTRLSLDLLESYGLPLPT